MAQELLTYNSSESFVNSNPEKLDLSDMTQKEKLGFIGESFLHSILKSVAKEFGLKVKWSGKKSYDKKLRNEKRRGVDFKLYEEHGQLFVANENKNLKNPEKQYSLETAQNVVVNRFNDVPHAKHKALSISNFNTFNYKARNLITSQRIEVFEFGKLIGSKDFRNKNFHVIKAKLRTFIRSLIKKDKLNQKLKQQEHKKIMDYINKQEQKQTNKLAEFILTKLLNSINIDTILSNYNNKTVDTPSNNKQLEIENVKHPQHKEWLNSELERLEKLDNFRELDI